MYVSVKGISHGICSVHPASDDCYRLVPPSICVFSIVVDVSTVLGLAVRVMRGLASFVGRLSTVVDCNDQGGR